MYDMKNRCDRCNLSLNELKKLPVCNKCGIQAALLNKLPQKKDVEAAVRIQFDFNSAYNKVSDKLSEIGDEQEKMAKKIEQMEKEVLSLDKGVESSLTSINDLKTGIVSKGDCIVNLEKEGSVVEKKITRQHQYNLSNIGLIKPFVSHNQSKKWELSFKSGSLKLLMTNVGQKHKDLERSRLIELYNPDILLSLHAKEAFESVLKGASVFVPTLGKWELLKVDIEGVLWGLDIKKMPIKDKEGWYLNASIMHNEENADVYLEYMSFPWKIK